MQEVWRVQLLEATGLGWDKKKEQDREYANATLNDWGGCTVGYDVLIYECYSNFFL